MKKALVIYAIIFTIFKWVRGEAHNYYPGLQGIINRTISSWAGYIYNLQFFTI